MQFEWDEAKRASDLAKHGVDFARVADFDWETALRFEDVRRPYGEQRWLALGRIGERFHTLIYTKRMDRVRVISLRKSKRQEVELYEQASYSPDT